MPRPRTPVGSWGNIRAGQLPSGKWVAESHFRAESGRLHRVRATAPSRSKAETELRRRMAEQDWRSGGGVITGQMRLEKVAQIWLWERSAAVESGRIDRETYLKNETVVRRFLIPRLGGLSVQEASTGRLDRTIQTLAMETVSGARQLRQVLCAMLAIAALHINGYTNAALATRPVTGASRSPEALTPDEVRQLRQAITNWQKGLAWDAPEDTPAQKRPGPTPGADLQDIITVRLATGARIGEILGLRWEDVELDPVEGPAVARITGQVVNEAGRGAYRKSHTKANTELAVPLPDWCVEVLRRRRGEVPSEDESGLVFPSRAFTAQSPNNVRRALRGALKGSPFEGRMHFHKLRKTVGTAIQRGAGLDDARAMLGHSSVAVTERYYVERLKQAPDHTELLSDFAPEEGNPDSG